MHGDAMTNDAAERERLLAELLAAEGLLDEGDADALVPREQAPTGDALPAPLSFAQEVLWMLDRASPGLAAYNAVIARRVRGALDETVLERALTRLVERHEALRTVFRGDGDDATQIVLPATTVTLARHDVRAVSAAERERAADAWLRAVAERPFDLASEPQFRAALVRVSDEEAILLLLSHHIVTDAWSYRVLLDELATIYAALLAGREPTLPALPVTYADFAAWQRRTMRGEKLEERLAFWRERLSGELPVLELPTDFPRPASQQFDGARVVAVLPASLVDDMKRLGQAYGASLYMVLLAAYQTVLHRWSGQDDIITGSPFAARTHREIEGLVGYFSQALPLRATFGDDPTFGALLSRVADAALSTFEHQDVPFEALVLELQRGKQLSHAPLFRCVLTMQDVLAQQTPLGGATMTTTELDVGTSKFDFTLLVNEVAAGLELTLWYRTDLFRGETASRFLGHLRTLLEAAVAVPNTKVSALPLLTAGERAQLAAWNETTETPTLAGVTAGATVVALFEAQAARVPERTAVTAGDVALTYAELNARANQLARHLQALGVSTEAPVGLLLDRSADAIVGLFGILKVGGAYVPLSVVAPAARLAQQLAECGAKVVVTSAALAGKLPAGVEAVALDRDALAVGALSAANLDAVATPEALAYVLYTSGSTGVPKGVAVTHANVVHYTRAVRQVLGVGPAALDGLHFGLASTLAADLGNTSLYPALLSGGTLHVLSKDVTTDPARFAEYVGTHALDVLKITPNHFAALSAGKSGAELAAVLPRRWLVLGGEALRPALARTLLGAGTCRVLNHYGPTETTVGACTFEATAASLAEVEAFGAQTVPVGRPLADMHAYVVPFTVTAGSSLRSEQQPVGVPGELLLGGAGVTRGYLKRDDLTAERFVSYNGERVYRTGDRARRLPDGTIEFLGRADDQVKVRGYRVELGEIEQSLRAHPGVAQGAVVLRGDDLVAYAVPKQAGYAVSHSDRPTAERLREWLAAQLPEHMVPNAVVLLDTLPLTPNGKLDKNALPTPDAPAAAADDFVAPRTSTEETVAKIWRDVLKKERVGVTESFLDLGGHSLLAIRVLGRINKELGVRLALRTLFETPTVARVAAIIEAELAERQAEAALREALAAIEGLSDAEVARQLAGDGSDEAK